MIPGIDDEIARRLGPGRRRVLDVGGARQLSRHATHVIDILSYEEACKAWGRQPYFNRRQIPPKNWIVRDICEDHPFPFPDKFFDFAICSGTLEDVRDPIRVCAELSRVAKAGYVMFPSPFAELTLGMDPQTESYAGYYHHRWLVYTENGHLVFLFKPHFIHSSRRFHFPRRFASRWANEGRTFTQLFWEGKLNAREEVIVVQREIEAKIEDFVRSVRGDTLSMKYARFKRTSWVAGVRVAEKLHVRDALRPVAIWLRRLP